jgi:hypothetical protein
MHGQMFNARGGLPVHQRSWTALTGYPTTDCAHTVQLRARTAIARVTGGGLPCPIPRFTLVTVDSAVQSAPWTASVHQRLQTALTGYPAADCADPVQLRARTACCRRALMQTALAQFSYARGLPAAPGRALMACAVIARLACRGWPAPLTNSGAAVYPRTTRRPQSTRPHSLR